MGWDSVPAELCHPVDALSIPWADEWVWSNGAVVLDIEVPTFSDCYLICRKSQMDCLGNELGLRR